MDLAKRINGLRDELQQLAAQAGSLAAARAVDQAACTASEPDAEHSTVLLEGRALMPGEVLIKFLCRKGDIA